MFIALCFLTYGTIIHEDVWAQKGYFENCDISIHPKYPDNVSNTLKKYITSPLVSTEWGDRSIVDATLILLFNAYRNNVEWFILCAEDSYPLKNYDYVEKELMNKKYSQFDFVFKEKTRASQWFIMCRKDVELLINAPSKIINFTPNKTPDENYFVQVLKMLGSRVIQGSSHYVKWPSWVTAHPVVFNKLLLDDSEKIHRTKSFFIRKTFPTFVNKVITPSKNCYIICIGTESLQTQNYDELLGEDIYILSMINSSLVNVKLKNKCIQFYYVVYKFINNASKILTSYLKQYYKNVVLIRETYNIKSVKNNTVKINTVKINTIKKNKTMKATTNVNLKVAFLFLIIDDINHPLVWTDYFNEHWDKILIYTHPKNPNNVKTPWLKNTIIKNLVPTGWGYIVEAYLELIKQAYSDGATHFVTISESCLPIYSLDKFLSFLGKYNSKTSYINFTHMSLYDLNVRLADRINSIKTYVKHDARFCLSRFHANQLLHANKKELNYFINTQVGDEFFLSVLRPLDNMKYIKVIAITYDNWDDVNVEVKRLKKIILNLTNELAYDPQKSKDIEELNNHINDIRKNPLTYTEINNEYIRRAFHSGSFFWRKFPKTLNVEGYYSENGAVK